MAGRGGRRSASFKPGNRANPGGRPKAIISLVELARAQTEESIKTLVAVRDDTTAPAAARVGASNALLDRGWGKPAQAVTQTIEQRRNIREWTTEQLIAYLNERRDSDGAAEEASGDPEPDSVH
jgi:hypothetical protein